MEVYILQHAHILPQGEEDVKLIGVYSSPIKALKAQERIVLLPGFSESPNGFSIDKYLVDSDHWTEGFISIPFETSTQEKQMLTYLPVNPQTAPNAVGEMLRAIFFEQKEGLLGGYSTHDWSDQVSPLSDLPFLDSTGYKMIWTRAELLVQELSYTTRIECRYVCDGDTTIEFHFDDGSKLINNDAKKVDRWYFKL